MRRRLIASSVVSLGMLVLWAGVPSAKEPPSPCAVRAEGYGGMAILDPDGQADKDLAANAGGTGSVGCLFAPFHFQGDVFGDYADVDKTFAVHSDYLADVGGGAHFGLSDPEVGAIEVTGAYNRFDAEDESADGIWHVGGEGEYYMDALTLGVQGGYIEADAENVGLNDDTGYYARALLRYYAGENMKLEGIGGVATLDKDVVPVARALVEYRMQDTPLALFARWESAFDNVLIEHTAVAGVRLYLFDAPATLRETDRRYFRESCVHLLAGARTC
jgi:hypothetical protein